MYTSLQLPEFCDIVSANGDVLTGFPDNEIVKGGVDVGGTGEETDTFDGNKTLAVCALVEFCPNVLLFLPFELRLIATFVPLFNSSISVASFDSIDGCLFWTFAAIVVIDGELLVIVALWDAMLEVTVAFCNDGLTVIGVFGATKLSVSVKRLAKSGGADGTTNDPYNEKKISNCNLGTYKIKIWYVRKNLQLVIY